MKPRVKQLGMSVVAISSLCGVALAFAHRCAGRRADIDLVPASRPARVAGAAIPRVIASPAYRELTGAGNVASLTAIVRGHASLHWSTLSGPGTVSFSDPDDARTFATFYTPGKYVLQATATEGPASANDFSVVRVWPATGRDQPYKTLFLGNSFTFYNGTVGYRFWQLAKAAREQVGDNYAASPFVKEITTPSEGLLYHWFERNSNAECTACVDHVLPAPPLVPLTDYAGLRARDVIRAGGFDVVFVQGYSEEPLTDPLGFTRLARKFDRLIKSNGGRTVFFQTWSYPGIDEASEEAILTEYERLAERTGAALSPVGRAFRNARLHANGYAKWPDGLLAPDRKHPSSFGTYLVAAMHYAAVYGKQAPAYYPDATDIPAPAISSDRARADRLRALAAEYAPDRPLASWR